MHATLAGYVKIGDQCYLGMHAVLHQRVCVGHFCMIGMNETIKRHVPPFALITDKRFIKINTRGLSLNGVTQDEIRKIETRYRSGTSDAPPSANQTVIDNFYASVTQGGVYQYEKATTR
jgi:UDP-N-acetylglucosamine acyltransferase